MSDEHNTLSEQDGELRRALSQPLLILFGLGTIIGAGIYVLIGEVARIAGMSAPISFVLAGTLAGFTAFSFAELSSRYPKSAGEAVYVREGLMKPVLPVLVGLSVVLVGIVSAATISNGFVGYLDIFINIPRPLAITGLVILLCTIAIWGISESVMVSAIITLVEVAGLLIIIAAGTSGFDASTVDRLPSLVPSFELSVWYGIFAGGFLAFYAFIGFEDMVNVAEEVKDVRRTLPRAIVITLICSTLLYFAVAMVAILAVPLEKLAGAEAPLALIYEVTTGGSPKLISAISIFAVVNGAMVQIIMASRILYGLREEWFIFKPFGIVNSVTKTPAIATFFVSVIVLILALSFSLTRLAEFTSGLTLVIFATVNLALWRIKRRGPAPEGIYTVPLWVPVIGFLVSAGFALSFFTGGLSASLGSH